MLSAEQGHPEHELNGVDVVGDDHQLGLLLLNEGGHVVQTILQHHGFLALLGLLAFGLDLGLIEESGILLGSGLGGVLLEELEETEGLKGGGVSYLLD